MKTYLKQNPQSYFQEGEFLHEESILVATGKCSQDKSKGHDEVDLLPPIESAAEHGETQALNPEYQGRSSVFGDKDTEAAATHRTVTKETCTFFTAWLEMLKKRAIIARRDVKGLINTILLPVVVIMFVMLILKLNIDPVGPQLPLQFGMFKKSLEMSHGFQQNLTVHVAGAVWQFFPPFTFGSSFPHTTWGLVL